MILFKTRTQARAFASKQDKYHVVDTGADAPEGRRWGVKVL